MRGVVVVYGENLSLGCVKGFVEMQHLKVSWDGFVFPRYSSSGSFLFRKEMERSLDWSGENNVTACEVRCILATEFK